MLRKLGLAGLALIGLVAAACGAQEARRPENLVLVSIDTLRPDRTSVYRDSEGASEGASGGASDGTSGGASDGTSAGASEDVSEGVSWGASGSSLHQAGRETTPALAGLAERGVVFEQAFSPAPWTLPAHAAMLTGRYPTSLDPRLRNGKLYRAAPLLSHWFRAAGYRRAAVTGGGFVSASFGADRGFDHFEQGSVGRAVEWIEEGAKSAENEPGGGAPFFLFFHTYVVHAPYGDRRFAEGLDGGRLEEIDRDGAHALEVYTRLCCEKLEPTEQEEAFLLALYDAGVARADEMVAELLAVLEREGLLGRTTVIVTSDHGEELWEHTGRAAYHGHTLYDELLRVPLVWYEPGLAAAGTRSDARVSLVDLLPTIVARFGLDAPADGGDLGEPGDVVEPGELDGRDLSPLLDGGAQRGGWSGGRGLFGEAVRHGPPRYSVSTRRGKLIETLDPEVRQGEGRKYPVEVRSRLELYLPGDPEERRNRADDRPELTAELLERLERHRPAAAPVDPAAPSEQPLDIETLKRLRELGYLRE